MVPNPFSPNKIQQESSVSWQRTIDPAIRSRPRRTFNSVLADEALAIAGQAPPSLPIPRIDRGARVGASEFG